MMSLPEPATPATLHETDKIDPPVRDHAQGLGLDVSTDADVDEKLAAIEMAGEEAATGWKPSAHQPLSPEVRYLHVSRTIHQLITDRNRSVGIFLFVASLLFGASTALLNAPARVEPIIPLAPIQYWCLPITFVVLAIIGAFVSLILIRTRIGLIYEVAKMNTLLGLPSQRVRRVNPLSIFFLMHSLVALLGAASAGLAAGMLSYRIGAPAIGIGLLAGCVYLATFQAAYYLTILSATSDSETSRSVRVSRESETLMQRFHLCVFCGSRIGRRSDYENAAKFLGTFLARNKIGLVYGGGRTGVMGALADAALLEGGRVVGVIPGHLTSKEVTHEGLSELVIVSSMHERKALMALRSQAFLALPGGVGTFEEFFEILTWSVLGLHQKPIAIWNVDGYFDPLIRLIELSIDEEFFWEGHRETIRGSGVVDEIETGSGRFRRPSRSKRTTSGTRLSHPRRLEIGD